MNRVMIASELVKIAKMLTADELKHNSPIDQWLDDNGWKETHGIGLYTNHSFPLVGVDTNSGKAAVDVYKSESDIFNDEGSVVAYTDDINKIKKAVNEGSVIGKLLDVLSKKYPRHEVLLPSGVISFWGKKDDVSFTIYTDNWSVVVGGSYKIGGRKIQRRMSPNVGNIVRFIEEAQKEILAGGGSNV